MELDVYQKDGTKSGETVKLSDEIFGIEPNEHAMYLAVRTYRTTSGREPIRSRPAEEVRGGGKKPFRRSTPGWPGRGPRRSD